MPFASSQRLKTPGKWRPTIGNENKRHQPCRYIPRAEIVPKKARKNPVEPCISGTDTCNSLVPPALLKANPKNYFVTPVLPMSSINYPLFAISLQHHPGASATLPSVVRWPSSAAAETLHRLGPSELPVIFARQASVCPSCPQFRSLAGAARNLDLTPRSFPSPGCAHSQLPTCSAAATLRRRRH